jgi:hypothetical protein
MSIFKTSIRLKNWLKVYSSVRKYSSENNILRSTCQDVEIRKIPLSNMVWDESTKLYPDKIALVKRTILRTGWIYFLRPRFISKKALKATIQIMENICTIFHVRI